MTLKTGIIIGCVATSLIGGLWFLDHRTVPDQHVFAANSAALAATPDPTPTPSPTPKIATGTTAAPQATPSAATRLLSSLTTRHSHKRSSHTD